MVDSEYRRRERISGIRALFSISAVVVVLLLSCSIAKSQEQTVIYNVLYTFNQSVSTLAVDSEEDFYGTANLGGNPACNCGEVFELVNNNGVYQDTDLYNFGYPPDGEYPVGPVILDAEGILYGTTSGGGTIGAGTIFKLDKNGVETILYNFTGGKDGGFPNSGLLLDAQNNLYGVTPYGGDLACNYPNGCGVVFKLNREGRLAVLHTFSGLDGETPNGPLVTDGEGNLYGTTTTGGSSLQCPAIGYYGFSFGGCGTVFRLDVSKKLTVLYKFQGLAGDGAYPTAGVVLDAVGNLYGTTSSGGYISCSTLEMTSCGTVFKVSPKGKENVLHRFFNVNGDGATPYTGIVRDASGNLYGTTFTGGNNFTCSGFSGFVGCGTIFMLDSKRIETILYNFSPGPNSSLPNPQSLFIDKHGHLEGTTARDGIGFGTVFELSASPQN